MPRGEDTILAERVRGKPSGVARGGKDKSLSEEGSEKLRGNRRFFQTATTKRWGGKKKCQKRSTNLSLWENWFSRRGDDTVRKKGKKTHPWAERGVDWGIGGKKNPEDLREKKSEKRSQKPYKGEQNLGG